jgi:hypothetical protein
MSRAIRLDDIGLAKSMEKEPFWETVVDFKTIFSGRKRVNTAINQGIVYYAHETEPYRHPEFGLGWKCRWHDRKNYKITSVWFVIFFSEPDLLIQEMKAAEWSNKQNKNKKPKGQKNESTEIH